MKILYVFPHPDDESFGPARAISAQVRAGHEVSLLTLTKGGATRRRHDFGYSIAEMGAVREREMADVARVLHLANLTVLDFPDSGLEALDPRVLEVAIEDEIEQQQPEILVTYAVHGVSGFHDHLVAHAVVKRVFVEMKERADSSLRRLAFFTLTEEQAGDEPGWHALSHSSSEDIDCLVEVDDIDMESFRAALDCYRTYEATIAQSGIRDAMDRLVAFEFFGESFDPPLSRLVDHLD